MIPREQILREDHDRPDRSITIPRPRRPGHRSYSEQNFAPSLYCEAGSSERRLDTVVADHRSVRPSWGTRIRLPTMGVLSRVRSRGTNNTEMQPRLLVAGPR